MIIGSVPVVLPNPQHHHLLADALSACSWSVSGEGWLGQRRAASASPVRARSIGGEGGDARTAVAVNGMSRVLGAPYRWRREDDRLGFCPRWET
jgi:hypothetical protein